MDNKELATLLRKTADALDSGRKILSTGDEAAIPANWIRIRPPFPKGAKFRDWPDPQFVSNAEGKQVSTITGYASSAQNLWRCSYFDANTQGGRLMQLGNADNELLKKEGPSAYPKVLDKLAFPKDYTDGVGTEDNRPWVSGNTSDDFEPVKPE